MLVNTETNCLTPILSGKNYWKLLCLILIICYKLFELSADKRTSTAKYTSTNNMVNGEPNASQGQTRRRILQIEKGTDN